MNHDPIIEPSSLRDLASFHLLDVRDPQSFDEGHVANAVRVPIEVWEAAAKAEETSFESVDYWQNAISALGLDPDVPWIVYDDGRMTEAARVWFILQFYGATAFILNGGLPSLREAVADVPMVAPIISSFSGSISIARPSKPCVVAAICGSFMKVRGELDWRATIHDMHSNRKPSRW
ncbi:rhodanese-like domain-containing protein [Rhizobium sp. YJ-22]|uniref:rhodanese-like domain-containing protein n=1 Tax=Rhizobium sp. YJ-22 TaxID=3037556 RepID=UPI001AD35455|nr:rhodanese-like domain-containing protein [Rhizobium sp. YJ-22]MBN9034146.1 hypothetical protein [Hyphomicrobiales bacterium]MDG3580459.1 rhodanese-like domain-containing protein [Rhizobium sp. YJ-22]